MTVRRWKLHDPAGNAPVDYTLLINPNAETSTPFRRKGITGYGRNVINGKHLVTAPSRLPADWSVTGVIRDKAMHDDIQSWVAAKSGARIQLTDHLNQQFVVSLRSFKPTFRHARRDLANSWTYTLDMLVYGPPVVLP